MSSAATPFAPRCMKDVLEEELFACRRDLLTTLEARAVRRSDGAASPRTIGPISTR